MLLGEADRHGIDGPLAYVCILDNAKRRFRRSLTASPASSGSPTRAPASKTGCRVQSQRYGHGLVADALARGALAVPLRARKVWEQSVPALARQPHDITTASQQSVYLSPGNLKLNGAKTPDAYDLLVNAQTV